VSSTCRVSFTERESAQSTKHRVSRKHEQSAEIAEQRGQITESSSYCVIACTEMYWGQHFNEYSTPTHPYHTRPSNLSTSAQLTAPPPALALLPPTLDCCTLSFMISLPVTCSNPGKKFLDVRQCGMLKGAGYCSYSMGIWCL
jgi:hypothetical protein